MAEETSLNIGGTWKDIDDCDVNIGGTWKQVTEIKANIAGTWKTVWTNAVLSLTGLAATVLSKVLIDPTSDLPEVAVRFKTDGQLQKALGDSGSPLSFTDITDDYLTGSTDGSLYQVRITENSQTGAAGTITLIGATLGVWTTDLSTQVTIEFQKDSTSVGAAAWDMDFEVREVADTSNIVQDLGEVINCEVSA